MGDSFDPQDQQGQSCSCQERQTSPNCFAIEYSQHSGHPVASLPVQSLTIIYYLKQFVQFGAGEETWFLQNQYPNWIFYFASLIKNLNRASSFSPFCRAKRCAPQHKNSWSSFLCWGGDLVTHKILVNFCSTPPHTVVLRLSSQAQISKYSICAGEET